jgi:antirestriction protein ArdC
MNVATGPSTESAWRGIFGRTRYGDEGYAREELVAELGAAFLSADLGITPDVRDNHAAYRSS